MSDIIDAAYRKGPGITSRAFAEDLLMTCLVGGAPPRLSA